MREWWHWNATLACGCEIRGVGWPTPPIGEVFDCYEHGLTVVQGSGGQNWSVMP